eukprot:sb/3462307/
MTTNRATTLFNLREEYLKAKQSTTRSSSDQGSSKQRKLKDIIQYRKEVKDKKQAERDAKQRKREARLALTVEEESALARSKSVLEAKTAAYDKLIRDSHREASESVLVDFSQKRSDGQDKVAIAYDYNNPSASKYRDVDGNINEGVVGPDEVHFANVDHAEVRSKGVGFYSFSEDTSVRAEQMEFLNSMRETTEKSKEIFEAVKLKRRQEKLDRLNRLRKRLNMSPPLDMLPREVLKEEGEDEKIDKVQLTEEADKVRREEEEKRRQTAVGRSIEEKFLVKEKTLWEKKVEQLREEREMDFAPVYNGRTGQEESLGADNEGYNLGAGAGVEEEDLGEDDEAITNFISFDVMLLLNRCHGPVARCYGYLSAKYTVDALLSRHSALGNEQLVTELKEECQTPAGLASVLDAREFIVRLRNPVFNATLCLTPARGARVTKRCNTQIKKLPQQQVLQLDKTLFAVLKDVISADSTVVTKATMDCPREIVEIVRSCDRVHPIKTERELENRLAHNRIPCGGWCISKAKSTLSPDSLYTTFSPIPGLRNWLDVGMGGYMGGGVVIAIHDEVHFANVDHAEVRSKGVGFYSFSEDVSVRAEQMEFLNSMRETTEKSKEIFEAAKLKRRQEKLDRLNRLRKRLNMSPPLDMLPREVLREKGGDEKIDKDHLTEEADKVRREEEEKRRQTAVGRSIEEKFLVKEKTLWEKKVEQLREEREMDFAPVYNNGRTPGGHEKNQGTDIEGERYDLGAGAGVEEEDLGEDDEAITNFISFVRHNT